MPRKELIVLTPDNTYTRVTHMNTMLRTRYEHQIKLHRNKNIIMPGTPISF